MKLEILKKLISYPSVTPRECGIYAYIASLLPHFKSFIVEKNGVKNIFFYYIPQDFNDSPPHFMGELGEGIPKKNNSIILSDSKASNPNIQNLDSISQSDLRAFATLKHICFAGHIDVVAPGGNYDINGEMIESKSVSEWEFPPFTPVIRGEYLHGRGSQDMKGGIACFLEAIISTLDSKNLQNLELKNHIISILLTSDEEGDGIYGTRYILEILKEKKILPHYAIVAEPTSTKIAGDTIKVGRRGSINGKITLQGVQGHAAYPEKCVNPIELLGEKLGKLAGVNLDSGDTHFAPSKLVITDIRGGIEAVNVTPSELKIMFNVRNSTLSDVDSVKSHIDSVLHGLPYTLTLKQTSKSFLTSADSMLVQMLAKSVKDSLGITPILSTSGGTSDARFFSEYGVEVAEIGVCNDTIHAINEKVALCDLENLTSIFKAFLRNLLTIF